LHFRNQIIKPTASGLTDDENNLQLKLPARLTEENQRLMEKCISSLDRPSLSSWVLLYLTVYIISCSVFRVFTSLMAHLKVINYFTQEEREKAYGPCSAKGIEAGINEINPKP
jgi:hypothetical protein